jgi:hypothetical protein
MQKFVGMRWSVKCVKAAWHKAKQRRTAHPAAGVTKWRTLEPLIRLPLERRATTDTSYCTSPAGKAMQIRLEEPVVQDWLTGRQTGRQLQGAKDRQLQADQKQTGRQRNAPREKALATWVAGASPVNVASGVELVAVALPLAA